MNRVLLFSLLLIFSTAYGDLIGRLSATPGGTDYQAWYDTSTDLTWTMDGTIGALDGWRFPTLDPNDLTATSNEMANLYYNTLGNTGDIWNFSPGPFIFPPRYWCEGAPDTFGDYCLEPRIYATDVHDPNTEFPSTWAFSFDSGESYLLSTDFYFYLTSLHVHDGDVNAVPVPESLYLFISGVIGVLGVSRRKQ